MRSLWFISAIGQGHVARCRPLVSSLQARGHSCVAAVAGFRAAAFLEDLCPVVRPTSRTALRRGRSSEFRSARSDAPAFVAMRDLEMTIAAHQASDEAALSAARFVADVLEREHPDVVVVDDMVLAGPVARSHGLPVVQVSSGPMLAPRACWASELGADPRVRCPSQLERLNRALASVAAGPIDELPELVDGDLILVPTPPEFGSAPGAVHLTIRSNLPHEAVPPLARCLRPRVAVSMGLVPWLAMPPIRAALALGLEVLVLQSNRLQLPRELLEHPDVSAVPTVDTGEWLSVCDLVIHHGGAGSALDGLLAGIPAVVIPTWTEQLLNAQALERRAVAVLAPVSLAELEPLELGARLVTLGHRESNGLQTRLVGAIERALHPAFALAARSWRDEILAQPGADEGALAIERLVTPARAVSRAS